MDSNKENLSDKKINTLYEKYSYPIMKACITESQKVKAMGISKLLWLFLVTGQDTEENIYVGIKSILYHHDEIISLGSLYFHKMKKALNKKEIQILKKYYESPEILIL